MDDGPVHEGRVEKNTNSKSSRANSKQQRCTKTATAKQESESQGTVERLQNNAEIQQSDTNGSEQIKKLKEESERFTKHTVGFYNCWRKAILPSIAMDQLKFHSKTPVSWGSYGTCYRVTFGGIEVAVKEILKYRESQSEEAEIISSLRNPHLPVLVGFAKSEERAFQVTKFHSYCGESVMLDAAVERKLLGKAINLNWLTLLGGVFQALSFLHEDVVHGVGHGLSQLKVPSTSTRFHGRLSNISIHFNNNMDDLLIPEGFHEIVIPDHPADLGRWLQTNGVQEDIIGIM